MSLSRLVFSTETALSRLGQEDREAALSGIFIERVGIGGPKTTALQSLSRRYSGVSWFRSSVGEQTSSTMRYSSPDRLDGTRVPRSWEVLPCGLESGCARTPTYDDPMAGG